MENRGNDDEQSVEATLPLVRSIKLEFVEALINSGQMSVYLPWDFRPYRPGPTRRYLDDGKGRKFDFTNNQNPFTNMLVLQNLLGYLPSNELLNLRSVCSQWDALVNKLLSKWPTRVTISIFDNLSTVCNAVKLYTELEKMSTDALNKCLLRTATLNFRVKDQNQAIFFLEFGAEVSMHLVLLREFGWMITSLRVDLKRVEDITHVMRSCPNLKFLDVEIYVHIPADWSKEDVKRGEKDDHHAPFLFRYSSENNSEIGKDAVVNESLESVKITNNIRWNFGPFLGEWAPKLKKISYKELGRGGRKSLFPHFTDQLSFLKTEELTEVHLEGGLEDKLGTSYAKILQMKWSSLKSFTLPITKVGVLRCIPKEYWDMLTKVASTLTTLNFVVAKASDQYYYEGETIPKLPMVTKAVVPSCIIDSSDFFKKMPNLKDIHIGYDRWMLAKYCTRSDTGYSLDPPLNSWTMSEVGFYRGNVHVWEDDDWKPVIGLRSLGMRISELQMIPITFPSIFPNLNELILEVKVGGLFQFSKLLECMSAYYHPLNILEIHVCPIHPDGAPSPDVNNYWISLDMKVAYTLIGIRPSNFLFAQQNSVECIQNEIQKLPYTIFNLPNLQRFTFKNAFAINRSKIISLLNVHGFAERDLEWSVETFEEDEESKNVFYWV